MNNNIIWPDPKTILFVLKMMEHEQNILSTRNILLGTRAFAVPDKKQIVIVTSNGNIAGMRCKMGLGPARKKIWAKEAMKLIG